MPLAELWAGQPALLLFWRHFACSCGATRAERLKAEWSDYIALGANVVLIGQAEPERSAARQALPLLQGMRTTSRPSSWNRRRSMATSSGSDTGPLGMAMLMVAARVGSARVGVFNSRTLRREADFGFTTCRRGHRIVVRRIARTFFAEPASSRAHG